MVPVGVANSLGGDDRVLGVVVSIGLDSSDEVIIGIIPRNVVVEIPAGGSRVGIVVEVVDMHADAMLGIAGGLFAVRTLPCDCVVVKAVSDVAHDPSPVCSTGVFLLRLGVFRSRRESVG